MTAEKARSACYQNTVGHTYMICTRGYQTTGVHQRQYSRVYDVS
jgi:hypothetical protein